MTAPYAWHILNGGEPCTMAYGDPEAGDDWQCCGPATERVGNLPVCPSCTKFLRGIGIGV